jgi:basic membrane protein A
MRTTSKALARRCVGPRHGRQPAAADVKACFIYVGPDRRFRLELPARPGPLAVEEHFGDKVETAYLESVPEGPDAERAIERFARSGCGIIFTTSFGYMDPTNKVAEEVPGCEVRARHRLQDAPPNVAVY